MGFSRGPNIVRDGLVLALDAASPRSYPGSGTTWNDLSGNGNNGTLTNGPAFDNGNNGSIVFDGVDDGVGIGTGNNYPYPYHTFEIWVKSSGLGSNNGGGIIGLDYGRVIAITTTGNIQYSWYTGVGDNQGLLFSTTTTNANLLNGNWRHIVCLRSESVYEIYIDGVLNKTGSNGGQPDWNGLNTWSGMGAIIGNNPNNANLRFLGSISSTKMYNRALTAAEIQQNYNATKGRYNL